MPLSPEQTETIKNQLVQNIDKSFPDDKKEFAKEQIESMDSEQLEDFLKRNSLQTKDGQLTNSQGGEAQCIFCSIISGDISSHKIAENEKSAAFLEINPLSKGHTIIIPKEHVSSTDEVPPEAFLLSKKISKKIKEKLNPKKVEVSSTNMFGHEIINVIPVYGDKIPSEKKQADKKELEDLQKLLWIEKENNVPVIKKSGPKKIDSKNIWLPKRIP